MVYYRWRAEYGGLEGYQVKRLKEPEGERVRLRRTLSAPLRGQISFAGGLK